MDVFAIGTGRKRRPKKSSISRSAFPPAWGGGFATVKEAVEPFALAYLAGHSDFSTTRRYVHPQADATKAAIDRARGGH